MKVASSLVFFHFLLNVVSVAMIPTKLISQGYCNRPKFLQVIRSHHCDQLELTVLNYHLLRVGSLMQILCD